MKRLKVYTFTSAQQGNMATGNLVNVSVFFGYIPSLCVGAPDVSVSGNVPVLLLVGKLGARKLELAFSNDNNGRWNV
jgi:hypothetical protein